MCIIKRKLKFQDYKNFLEAVQTENKINRLEKNKVEVNSLKEDKKKFMKNSKLISKTKQRFTSEKHQVLTEEVNKIALNSNDDKIMQSIDSKKIYAHGASTDLVSKKEDIKCNNVIN